ncbi:RNA-directed DNA polymerase, eukaryota [Tanacetum coccineum]|uniref:RNA-directed DNA polymerase, eukaryota n=1 Tax=Tanacetum coccineum TaxID=301880 RepID=A0ABQ5G8P4_9ASTR
MTCVVADQKKKHVGPSSNALWKVKLSDIVKYWIQRRFKEKRANSRLSKDFPDTDWLLVNGNVVLLLCTICLRIVLALSAENPISKDGIFECICYVWGYGENKSLGPDRFTFEFFRKFWHVVGSDFCTAIRGCLNSSMASILVNGSPTSEFQFHRGLKQGGPLAPYLFILVMESLHLYFSRVIDAGIFTGVRIDPSIMISHLFYADDTVFIGEWSQENLKVMKALFKYLGVTVGGNTSLVKSWDETINKLKLRLSKWKLKTLSIGGRLTLLKSVLGSTPIYNMSLYKVPKAVLNSMEAIRRNLFNGTQDNERKISWIKWAKDLSVAHPSNWSSIVKEVNALKTQVSGGVESSQLSHILDILGSVILSNSEGRWIWDSEFRVKDVRNLLDEAFLPKADSPTRCEFWHQKSLGSLLMVGIWYGFLLIYYHILAFLVATGASDVLLVLKKEVLEDNDSDDGKVLNELIEYENVGMLCQKRAIKSFDGDDLEFQCYIDEKKIGDLRMFLYLDDAWW